MVQGICLGTKMSFRAPKLKMDRTYLYFGFEDEVSVAGIRQTEYASKLIHGEIANIPNFEFGRLMHGEWDEYDDGQRAKTDLGAHLQLDDLDLVCDDGRFVALVERVVEHLNGIGVKLVGEARPLKGE